MSAVDVVDGAPLPTTSSDRLIVVNELHQGAAPMQITTIGLDMSPLMALSVVRAPATLCLKLRDETRTLLGID